jgi:hypothetical protein
MRQKPFKFLSNSIQIPLNENIVDRLEERKSVREFSALV